MLPGFRFSGRHSVRVPGLTRAAVVRRFRPMILRSIQAVMTVLFAVGVAVQYNDPDPLQWMAVYGAATLMCAWTAWKPPGPPRLWPVLVAVAALAWAFAIAPHALGRIPLGSMFQSWEMKNTAVEENRETYGLFIIAAWMLVTAFTRPSAKRG